MNNSNSSNSRNSSPNKGNLFNPDFKIFLEIDEIILKFAKEIINIEVSFYEELNKITPIFTKYLKCLLDLIDKEKSIPDNLKKTVKSRIILDFYSLIADKYSFNILELPNYLGEKNRKLFLEAQKNIV